MAWAYDALHSRFVMTDAPSGRCVMFVDLCSEGDELALWGRGGWDAHLHLTRRSDDPGLTPAAFANLVYAGYLRAKAGGE